MIRRLSLLVPLVLVGLLPTTGCHISDYPVITDDRGDYSGVIRTGHKAYIVPSFPVATAWTDGTDEMFSMAYQNQYGDQKLYTFNNFDPTASVLFLDQTYCDWKYEGCAAAISWNPIQNDEVFDYEKYADHDCSGARSLCYFATYTARIGECGDAFGYRDPQAFFREFSQLQTSTWRGERAYLVPIDSTRADITLIADDGTRWSAPILGKHTLIATDRLQFVLPMTPATRHTIQWARQWADEHGERARAELRYGGIEVEVEMRLRPEGLSYNSQRF